MACERACSSEIQFWRRNSGCVIDTVMAFELNCAALAVAFGRRKVTVRSLNVLLADTLACGSRPARPCGIFSCAALKLARAPA